MFTRPLAEAELAQVPFLSGLSKKQLGWVSRLSTQVEVPAGGALARGGHLGAEFFILLDGQIEIILQGGALVATHDPRFPFGDIAVLSAHPVAATLIAQTAVRARVASRQEFAGLLAEVPEVSARLHSKMA
jgi:trk system potassium uptake protein TrkA